MKTTASQLQKYIILHDTVLFSPSQLANQTGLVPDAGGIGNGTVVRGIIEMKNYQGTTLPPAPFLHIHDSSIGKLDGAYAPAKSYAPYPIADTTQKTYRVNGKTFAQMLDESNHLKSTGVELISPATITGDPMKLHVMSVKNEPVIIPVVCIGGNHFIDARDVTEVIDKSTQKKYNADASTTSTSTPMSVGRKIEMAIILVAGVGAVYFGVKGKTKLAWTFAAIAVSGIIVDQLFFKPKK